MRRLNFLQTQIVTLFPVSTKVIPDVPSLVDQGGARKGCLAYLRVFRQHLAIHTGGLKIWECSLDLALFLLKEDITWEAVSVLEIGCGAAVPGLLAMQLGCPKVDFQDYVWC